MEQIVENLHVPVKDLSSEKIQLPATFSKILKEIPGNASESDETPFKDQESQITENGQLQEEQIETLDASEPFEQIDFVNLTPEIISPSNFQSAELESEDPTIEGGSGDNNYLEATLVNKSVIQDEGLVGEENEYKFSDKDKFTDANRNTDDDELQIIGVELAHQSSCDSNPPFQNTPSSPDAIEVKYITKGTMETTVSKAKPNKDGSLLRLFQSELFDTYFHMFYLHHRQEPGIHDYLVNLLYRRAEEDIHFYLPQLCQLCLSRYKTSIMHHFILEKASKSMHLALKSAWLFQASCGDGSTEFNELSLQLNQEIEMAIVNSKPVPLGSTACSATLAVSVPDLFERRKAVNKLQTTHNLARRSATRSKKAEGEDKQNSKIASELCGVTSTGSTIEDEKAKTVDFPTPSQATVTRDFSVESTTAQKDEIPSESLKTETEASCPGPPSSTTSRPVTQKQRVAKGFVQKVAQISISGAKVKLPSVYNKLGSPFQYSSFRDTALMGSEMQQFIVKQRRCDYFNLLNSFTSMIIEVSNKLSLEADRNLRLPLLRQFLEALNEWMFCRRCIVAACEGTFAMTGVNIPLSEFGSLNPVGRNTHSTQIVRFIPDECRVLSSKKRAPYLLVFEVADLDEDLQRLPSIFRLTTAEFSQAVLSGGSLTNIDDTLFRTLSSYKQKTTDSPVANSTRDTHGCRKSSDSTHHHAPLLWNHLYVYSSILKEVTERNLYRPPSCEFAEAPSALSSSAVGVFGGYSSESPLNALRRSMGLRQAAGARRTQSRTGITLPGRTDAVLTRISDEGLVDIEANSGVVQSAPPSEVPQEVLDLPGASIGVAQSEPEPSTETPRQHESIDPASVLDTEDSEPLALHQGLDKVRIFGTESEAKESSAFSKPAMYAGVACPSSPALLQLADQELEGTTPVTSLSSPLDDLSAALATTSNSMTQLHAPHIPPSSNSTRRKSFHGSGTQRSLSPSSNGKVGLREPSTKTQSAPLSVFPSYTALWGLATGVIGSVKPKEANLKKEFQWSPLRIRETRRPLKQLAIQTTSELKPTLSSSTTALTATEESGFGDETLTTSTRSEGDSGTSATAAELAANASKIRYKLWGDLWREKKRRYRRQSPYGSLKSWNLGCVLVKGGDDVRQEMLASQLVRVFKTIFEEARLPLYLRPYEILITGQNSGIMVFVPDTISIDNLKKKFGTDSVAKVFEAAFADNPYEAKKNFIESHAAYSIIAYFLQVKDRHNGNYLLDAEGHVIHIDYGFMLSNSPGNVNFESSPFKLTAEFMDVMDGELSDNFEYFRTLVVRGFLEARKHAERLFLLVEMMLSSTKMPCFAAGAETTFLALKERFMLNLTEEMCIQKIVDLIDASVNNWRTIQYDNFQRITNGIM